MKIGIDARLIDETGVGRYIRNLICELSTRTSEHIYIVYLRSPQYESFQLPAKNWQKRQILSRWHTISEQLEMPYLFIRDRLDLVHIPYFTAPILYPGVYILTIHDLIVLHTNTGKASLMPYPFYIMKKIAYTWVLRLGILRARHIVTVSHTVRNELIKMFPQIDQKVSVTYEGVDRIFGKHRHKHNKDSYLLYVGNAYPHKRVDVLIDTFLTFKNTFPSSKASLYLIGRDDLFYTRLRHKYASFANSVIFKGPANEKELAQYYAHAAAYVSFAAEEGFGLPPIEALWHRTRVIVSDIPIFHEILGKFAMYVRPHNTQDAIKAMESIIQQPIIPDEEFDKILDFLTSRYSWHRLAELTLKVYESV